MWSLWPLYVIGQAIMFSSSGFFFLLLFSSPILSRKLDVYHTSTHDVALVRIYNARLKCAARGSLTIQDAKIRKKSPSAHHHTSLSGCIVATNARIDNRKKRVKQQYFLHAFSQYGERRPTNS